MALSIHRRALRRTPCCSFLLPVFSARRLVVNPYVDWSLSPGAGPVTLDVDAKVASAVNGETLFAVVDHDFEQCDVNLGLGKGLTHDADRWSLKFIVGTHF